MRITCQAGFARSLAGKLLCWTQGGTLAHPQSGHANRLIHEKSPYLLQHAYNPVDWYPWGEEAFQRARDEDKPIFLSIGYSTCHWCHVMERESFESPEVAEVMNRHFVNIKMDREERPDIDRVYMTYVQATTGSGGWPLSAWLTPDLKPFYGGTYFPPDDRWGRSSFVTVLKKIAEVWKEQRDAVLRSSENTTAQLRAAMAASTRQLLDTSALYRAFKTFQQNYDANYGGFGAAPKFPRPVTHNLLLRYFARTGDQQAARMVLGTMFAMAHGGMYDHLGGGFHRYSVDAFWHVPHFEKMLYDQAQLVTSALEAFQISDQEFYARIARQTMDYVLRDLTDRETGGFYSAEDADSLIAPGSDEKREGAFYVWTREEIEEALGGPDAEVLAYYYGVKPEGNADDPHGELSGKNVLHVVHTAEEAAEEFGRTPREIGESLERSRARLGEIRDRRTRPHLDDKIISAWNGLMISAFAKAFQVLDEPRYLEAAQRAAGFAAGTLYRPEEGTLWRRYRDGQAAFDGYLEDYAFLVQALIDLYEASFERRWLELAERLTAKMIELFWDEQAGGFFNTSGRDPSVLLRFKDDYDGAEPSGNSIAALNLARLSEMLDRAEWRQLAERTVQAFSEALNRQPHAMPQMLVAYDFIQAPVLQVVIAGESGDDRTRRLLHVVNQHFLPARVLMLADEAARRALGERLPWFGAMMPVDGQPAAYVCRHYACERPLTDPAALAAALSERRDQAAPKPAEP